MRSDLQTPFNERPKGLSVEFYPSIEDIVHVSLQLGEKVNSETTSLRAYQAFLILNAIGFPAYLLLSDQPLWALFLVSINVALIMFLVPRVNADTHKKYYEQLIGDRERNLARADISEEGILYTSDGGYSFWPWDRITLIEETTESIYFYFHGNGFGVRKNGFAYHEEQKVFTDFAYAQWKGAKTARLAS